MRAIAIALVLVYHAGVQQLPGGFVGVDVFFVISGFLITGLLIRELERDRKISLTRFYARRAKRLLPATGVVLAATTVLTWLTISVVDWRDFGLDIIASALYVVNWQLAHRSVDYLAEDVGLSPVQHFWSLAVEEQFYIVWPLLLAVLAWSLKRRRSVNVRRPMSVAIALLIIVSFASSIYFTSDDPARAFFITPTRLWELGIGAAVAIGTTWWPKIPSAIASGLGWIGLGFVALSGLIFDASTAWPGYAALAPTLGTAAMIIAGFTHGRLSPARLLSIRPAVWIGGLSYSLYLWHWPLIVAATSYWGELSARQGLLVIAISFVPAYLSYKLVENPLRFAKPLARSNTLTLSIGANFTAMGAAAGLILLVAVPSIGNTPSSDDDIKVTAPGATALDLRDAGTVQSLSGISWFTPDATSAEDDLPEGYERGCQVDQNSSALQPCEWGDPNGDILVVVVGDSKMLQWQSALQEIADQQGWRIISHTKSACGFHSGVQLVDDKPYTSCTEWNENVMDELVELEPDFVLTSQRINVALDQTTGDASVDMMVDAMVTQWSVLLDMDIPLIVLLDNPNPGFAVYECIAENEDNPQNCTFSREDGIANSGALAQEEAVARLSDVHIVDLRPKICPDNQCVPIIGNVLLYRQTSHLTDTYVRTLTGYLAPPLVEIVEQHNNDSVTG